MKKEKIQVEFPCLFFFLQKMEKKLESIYTILLPVLEKKKSSPICSEPTGCVQGTISTNCSHAEFNVCYCLDVIRANILFLVDS